MTREEEAAQILQALGKLPEEVLRQHLPGYSAKQVRDGLACALRTLPRPPRQTVRPQPLFPEPAATRQQGEFSLYTDGASRGNPGEAGAGFVILDGQGEELMAQGRYLGTCTNNAAEYQALILGLKEAARLGAGKISIFLDSQLIVRQVLGQYKVKSSDLQPLFAQVKKLLTGFEKYEIRHVPREQNKRADQLANRGIDDRLGVGA